MEVHLCYQLSMLSTLSNIFQKFSLFQKQQQQQPQVQKQVRKLKHRGEDSKQSEENILTQTKKMKLLSVKLVHCIKCYYYW